MFGYRLTAQDTLIKKNGDKVIADIIEISTNEIKYKRFQMPNSPLYIDHKNNVLEIHYTNGLIERYGSVIEDCISKQSVLAPATAESNNIEAWGTVYYFHGVTLTESDLYDVLLEKSNPTIQQWVDKSKRAKRKQALGYMAIPLAIGSTFLLAGSYGLMDDYVDLGFGIENSAGTYVIPNVLSGVFLSAAVSLPIISSIATKNKLHYNKQAIKIYNEKY